LINQFHFFNQFSETKITLISIIFSQFIWKLWNKKNMHITSSGLSSGTKGVISSKQTKQNKRLISSHNDSCPLWQVQTKSFPYWIYKFSYRCIHSYGTCTFVICTHNTWDLTQPLGEIWAKIQILIQISKPKSCYTNV